MEQVSNFFLSLLCIFAIYLVIGVLWQAAEFIIYGKTTPKLIDDVVAFILAISIFINLR